MPKVIQYQCDIPGCKAIRGEANHWFLGWVSGAGYIVIAPLEENEVEDTNYPDKSLICGEEHVHKFVSISLTKLFPESVTFHISSGQ